MSAVVIGTYWPKNQHNPFSETESRRLFADNTYQLLVQEDEMLKQLQFFSVASDGRVTLWTLAKSELLHQVLPQSHVSATD